VPADAPAFRAELAHSREAQSETLKRVEQAVDSIAIELERVGEGQRFLTRVLGEPGRRAESSVPTSEPASGQPLRRSLPDEAS
jgi:hypothetical protein